MTKVALTAEAARARVREAGSAENARVLQGYFKTGPGEYGEGDVFVGVRLPVLRKLAREFDTLPLDQAAELLRSEVHEERLLALLVLVRIYQKAKAETRRAVFDLYLAHTRFINNWDLVDSSAEHIIGAHLAEGDRSLLDRLASSKLLWERRIAILSTFHFIRRGQFDDTLRVSEILLSDRHDLIHKAVGWMLREVGRRDQAAEEAFLRRHHAAMPRTMLRYAIERFPEPLRQRYLRGEVESPD